MKTINIMLNSINDIKALINAANEQTFDIDLLSGRYVIDAKSIMGVFSLDLSKPIKAEIHASDEEAAVFLGKIKDYIVG